MTMMQGSDNITTIQREALEQAGKVNDLFDVPESERAKDKEC